MKTSQFGKLSTKRCQGSTEVCTTYDTVVIYCRVSLKTVDIVYTPNVLVTSMYYNIRKNISKKLNSTGNKCIIDTIIRKKNLSSII